jgi:hypothetical protein
MIISEYLSTCLGIHTCEENPLDQTLLALFELDVTKTLSYCSHLETWLVAHLADIFYHTQLIQETTRDFSFDLREHFLLEYVDQLGYSGQYWQIALAYLSYCPVMGKERMHIVSFYYDFMMCV